MVNTPNDIQIFDRALMGQKRRRAAGNFDEHGFLFEWAAKQLKGRLDDITRNFPITAQLGARGGALTEGAVLLDINDAYAPHIISDDEFLPLKSSALDMVISNLCLHSVNDLPGVLSQINHALKPDGLFIAAMFGGESLHELRTSLSAAEIALHDGLSPRVFPFADKQQLGALMQRAGFALPVVDSEIITVTYDSMFKLLSDIRGMGEGNIIAARDKRFVGREFFMHAAQHYAENFAEDDGRIVASFEIIFLIGWAPHDSQQKPLRPGSAKNRLADALGSKETNL